MKVEVEIAGVADITPKDHADPMTEVHKNTSFARFDILKINHAYYSRMMFDNYSVDYEVGGLYPTAPPVLIKNQNSNFTLSIISKYYCYIEIYEGMNSRNPVWVTGFIPAGASEFSLPAGLYTVIASSTGQVNYKQNIGLFENTVVKVSSFPILMNEGFTIQLISDNSTLASLFEYSPSEKCKVDLKFPRCGGARMLKNWNSEIFKVSEISASYYLVYAVGEFQKSFVKFYSKGYLREHFELYGKSEKGAWMIFCVNGRKGINSLKVLDYYAEKVDFDVCKKMFGELTWNEKEMKKGSIKVEGMIDN